MLRNSTAKIAKKYLDLNINKLDTKKRRIRIIQFKYDDEKYQKASSITPIIK